VGVTALRFRAGSDLGAGANEIRVQLNGQDSNTVYLPVE
jgi:hypothetical protein